MPRFRQNYQGLPNIPFDVNWASLQARGLSHWWPGLIGYKDLVAGANGAPTGNPSPVVTDSGPAFYFTGTNGNYINCGSPANVQGLSKLTVSAWINTNTLDGGDYGLRYAFGCEGYSSGWFLRLNTGDDKLYWYVFSGDYRAAVSEAITVNTWYHVACVYDASVTAAEQLKLYVNNILYTGTSGSGAIASGGNLWIGANPADFGRSWGGYIRDFRIYSGIALSPNEIFQINDPLTRYELYRPLRRMWAATTLTASPPTPTAPSGLTATASTSDTIDLVWSDNSADETGFKIQRSANGVTFADLDTAAANAESYSDTTCSPNTRYWYKVCATNDGGDSAYTDSANAKTPPDNAGKAYKYLLLTGGQVEQSDGRYLALVDGVPAPDTVAGIAWLYVDQADGDLKVKFGDGTVKVLSADT